MIIRHGDDYLSREELKNQLLSRVDEIVDCILKDKTLELRTEKNNLCVFCVNRKKLVKIK